MDTFTAVQPPVPVGIEPSDGEWEADLHLSRFLTGWYQCQRALAHAGNNVIADVGFLKREWLVEQAWAMDGISALLVGVLCPLTEVERRERERERGDRALGYAREQYDLVHASVHGFCAYDVTVDTSRLSPAEAARVVATALADPPKPSALAQLRVSVSG